MATIYLYKFNNYYNRTLKRSESIEGYGEYLYIETGTNLNFSPSDGVDTEHIVGRQNNPYYGDCDYLIYSEDNINITSRWFILKQVRVVKGQYRAALRRDVIADNYDKVINSAMFIEKATLPEDSPLIFNSENMSVNQIKKSETLLKDTTKCAWICGYVGRDYGGGEVEFSAETIADDTVDDLNNWYYGKYIGKWVNGFNRDGSGCMIPEIYFYAKEYVIGGRGEENIKRIEYNGSWSDRIDNSGTPSIKYKNIPGISGTLNNMFDSFTYKSYYPKYLMNNMDEYSSYESWTLEDYYNIERCEGKIIHLLNDSTDKYYKMRVQYERDIGRTIPISYDAEGAPLKSYLQNCVEKSPAYTSGEVQAQLYIKYNRVKLTLEEVASGEYKIRMPAKSERYHLKDAPYDMFCIPYGDGVTIKNTNVGPFDGIKMSKSESMSIAQGIAEGLGKNLYDMQLLPYCPMSGFDLSKADEGVIDIRALSTMRYTFIKDNNPNEQTTKGVILWSTSSQGTIDIPYSIEVSNKKISNETDMWRICSPNYNGTFCFSAAKNNGVSRINIDYTYMPYNPYIHINPDFSGLYGKDFNDSRGMTVQGDFSICYLSDSWVEYQVQNKNYLNIFNRQVQNMEVNNKIHNTSQIFGASSGVIGAIAGGAAKGGVSGALLGGMTSAVGAVGDYHIKRSLQAEAIDYTRDNFGYQLGNIQATPDSIANTTAYTANNKIFPIIEYYTCTESEKRAVANKIANNGMTVMTIGSIGEYINNTWSYEDIIDRGYIKGQLININGVDYNTAIAISEELNKGVFTK